MSRKIEIELTSARPDGSWTWRVAGAKQPKGVLDGSVLPPDAKVGDVLRAEAEFELEGTVITSVLPPPPKRVEPARLQLLADNRPFEGVTTSLVPKSGRPRRDRDDMGPRPERRDGPGGPRQDRPGAPRSDRPGAPRSDRPGAPRTDRPGAPRTDRPTGPRTDRPGMPRTDGPGAPRSDRPTGPRTDRQGGPRTDRVGGPAGSGGPTGPGRDRAAGRERVAGRHGESSDGRRDRGVTRPKRLNPGSVHRNAVLDSLAPEERAVADQLLQGGIPAVRRALQEQNARVREAGGPEIKADALLGLAEQLLPRLKAAEWRDRAEAAAKEADELNLRDLRSIVAGADAAARDDESRILAKSLREDLDRREAAERDAWLADITTCLDEGRVTRALRVAGRPPDPRTRFPAELMSKLSDAASTAMTPDTPVDRWAALLAAVLESPVRRSVKPVGLPASPGDALLGAARQASGRIPALAALLGLDMPPPPGPPRAGIRPARPGGRPPVGARRPAPSAPPGSSAPGSTRPDATAAPPAPEDQAMGVSDPTTVSPQPEGPPALPAGSGPAALPEADAAITGAPEVVVPGAADVVPGAADVVPGAADVVPGAADVVPAAADVVPGAADVVPGGGEIQAAPAEEPAHDPATSEISAALTAPTPPAGS